MECTNGQPAGYRRNREQSNTNAASRDQNGANKNPLHHRGFYRPPVFPANRLTTESRRADSNRLLLLITRKNRLVSGSWRLFQNPLGKPNTGTSNILEQPEIRPGWCTVGVRVPHIWLQRSASLGPGDAVGPFVRWDFLELAVYCGDEGSEVLVAEGVGYEKATRVGTA
jgi:hypothetical protein